jgi:hypothetical protein
MTWIPSLSRYTSANRLSRDHLIFPRENRDKSSRTSQDVNFTKSFVLGLRFITSACPDVIPTVEGDSEKVDARLRSMIWSSLELFFQSATPGLDLPSLSDPDLKSIQIWMRRGSRRIHPSSNIDHACSTLEVNGQEAFTNDRVHGCPSVTNPSAVLKPGSFSASEISSNEGISHGYADTHDLITPQ